MLILLFKIINTINSFEYKNITTDAEKMAQWQRMVAFPGDQSSISSTHMAADNYL